MKIANAPSQAHLQGTQSQHTKANPDSYRIGFKLTSTPFARDSMWTMLLRGLVIKEKMLIWKRKCLLKR